MRRARDIATLVVVGSAVAACMGASPPVYHPAFVRDVETESDKAVQVVSNDRLPDHEARAVSASFVGSAMLASGFFNADDARDLGGFLASELGAMGPREQLRIVAWDHDAPRIYYVFIGGGKLRIEYYQRGEELDRHVALIPAEAVAMSSPPPAASEVPADDATSPAPAPAAEGASAPRAGDAVATAAPTAAARPATGLRSRGRRPASPSLPPIGEDEARRKINELDLALRQGLVTLAEHKRNRKAILARL